MAAAVEQRAEELLQRFQEVIARFERMDISCAKGPQAELRMAEVRIVEHLGGRGPLMMRELAEAANVAVNTMTSIVDGLEAKDVVLRTRVPEDRRIIRVELTAKGAVVYRSVLDEHIAFCRALLSGLTEEEQEIYMVLMRKVARSTNADLWSA